MLQTTPVSIQICHAVDPSYSSRSPPSTAYPRSLPGIHWSAASFAVYCSACLATLSTVISSYRVSKPIPFSSSTAAIVLHFTLQNKLPNFHVTLHVQSAIQLDVIFWPAYNFSITINFEMLVCMDVVLS